MQLPRKINQFIDDISLSVCIVSDENALNKQQREQLVNDLFDDMVWNIPDEAPLGWDTNSHGPWDTTNV